MWKTPTRASAQQAIWPLVTAICAAILGCGDSAQEQGASEFEGGGDASGVIEDDGGHGGDFVADAQPGSDANGGWSGDGSGGKDTGGGGQDSGAEGGQSGDGGTGGDSNGQPAEDRGANEGGGEVNNGADAEDLDGDAGSGEDGAGIEGGGIEGGGTDLPPPTGRWCCPPPVPGEDSAKCPLKIVRSKESDRIPAAFQLTLTWDPAKHEVVGFSDEWCFRQGCFDLPVPPNGLSPHGHSLALAPFSLNDWNGTGSILATLLASPVPPISTAYFSPSGAVINDPDVVDLSYRALTAEAAEAPLCFEVSALSAADPAAITIFAYAADTWIITAGY